LIAATVHRHRAGTVLVKGSGLFVQLHFLWPGIVGRRKSST
jgi:hypothetical protein